MAAIIAGTFTSVRYVLTLTDTITANQQEIINLTKDLKQAQKILQIKTQDYHQLKQRGLWLKTYIDN